MKEHHYELDIRWTGNGGTGTSHYAEYDRSFDLQMAGKKTIACSSDVPFRGDGSKPNPEDFLVASISSCHMLWYLHLCADAGVTVVAYTDRPTAVLTEMPKEGGRFTSATLHPLVTIEDESKVELAAQLHEKAHHHCFISNSCNFPITIEPKIQVK
jgi:organic hydroperoxide reductase OsmC/OhrA